MNFAFSDEQQMLRDQAQRFLLERSPLTTARAVLESDADYDKAVWKGMAELGWMGTAIPETYGGVGLGHLELSVLAEELGRALAPTPFASSVYLAAEALLQSDNESVKRTLLPDLANGSRIGTLALAEGVGVPAPGRLKASVSHGRLSGSKLPVPDGMAADLAVVVAQAEQGRDSAGLFVVDLTGSGVSREPVNSIDPSRPMARIDFDGAEATALGDPATGWDDLSRLLDRAAVLMAFEQVGGAQAALEMARDYALERYAFGRPIGSFQAIKHKLADMYVATELARSNAYYGAWALSTDAPELPVAAATARISATDAYHLSSKENIQTHGGMGFTWEFDCHLYYRRSKHLALALGSQRRWKDALITRLEERNAA
jgi:acyl-CoA dehydrogenase